MMTMDVVLCDELLEEILRRVPSSYSSSVSLVSKRWLFLRRSSTTSLSLRIPSSPFPHLITNNDSVCTATVVSNILSHYPFLSDLAIISSGHDGDPPAAAAAPSLSSSDDLLLVVAVATCSRHLSHLRFHPANSPLSPSALLSASSSLRRLTSLHISALLPLSFRWLACFPSLKSLSLVRSRAKQFSDRESGGGGGGGGEGEGEGDDDEDTDDDDDTDLEVSLVLPLESLSLSGIRSTDRGLSWLWRRCGSLRWLQLRACDGTGPPSSFALCLTGLLCLELRTCRAIADRVLLQAAEHCRALTTLLLYDGGSRDALRQFIHQCGSALRVLDLRLPLDLHNDHLFAIAAGNNQPNHRIAAGPGIQGLSALRLQSCCLVTGDGLRSLARAPVAAAIEELALVNCDVVEREPGLLTFLGQSMPGLRRLDLSHNELLADKEVASMLASCRNLVDIRMRGCKSLTGTSMFYLLKHCSRVLEVVDVSHCPGINAHAVEIFIPNATRLDRIIVEESKLSDAAKAFASRKAIKTS